jgi:hypothetical protein
VPCIRCLGKYLAAAAVRFYSQHFPPGAAV